jgi:hypothetical protein
MKDATQRSIFRWIHVVASVPILGYIYSPFERPPDYAPATRLPSCHGRFGTLAVEKAMSFDD